MTSVKGASVAFCPVFCVGVWRTLLAWSCGASGGCEPRLKDKSLRFLFFSFSAGQDLKSVTCSPSLLLHPFPSPSHSHRHCLVPTQPKKSLVLERLLYVLKPVLKSHITGLRSHGHCGKYRSVSVIESLVATSLDRQAKVSRGQSSPSLLCAKRLQCYKMFCHKVNVASERAGGQTFSL